MKAPNWKPTQRAPEVVLCPRCGLPGGRPLFTSIDPCAWCSGPVPPEADATDEFDMPLYLTGPGKSISWGPLSPPHPAQAPVIPSGAMYAGTVVKVIPGSLMVHVLQMSVVSAAVVQPGCTVTAARIYPDTLHVLSVGYSTAELFVTGRADELHPFDILYRTP